MGVLILFLLGPGLGYVLFWRAPCRIGRLLDEKQGGLELWPRGSGIPEYWPVRLNTGSGGRGASHITTAALASL